MLLSALGVFAAAILWPATPPVQSASPERQVVSAFTPQASDALWRDVNTEKVSPQQQRQDAGRPNKYRSLNLDTIHLQSLLRRAPREFTAAAKNADAPIISLPMPDGSMLRFKIHDSPIMEEALAARFPQIRTFSGQAFDGSAATTRFDWTPQGFHAIVLTPRGTVLIEPDGPNGGGTVAGGFLNVDVTRGESSGAATVNFATSDAAGLTNCTIANGVASERCDYATTVGTLRFAAGESNKVTYYTHRK